MASQGREPRHLLWSMLLVLGAANCWASVAHAQVSGVAVPAIGGGAAQPSNAPGIYTMNADGSNVRLLAKVSDARWHGWPNWTRDGKEIVFEAQGTNAKPADTHLYVVPATGGVPKDIGIGKSANWSPDGKQIVFWMQSGNTGDAQGGVWLMNADGTGRQFMFPGRAPKYSADGGKILTVHNRTGGDTVYSYDVLEGTRTSILKEDFQRLFACAISPDGKQVCVTGIRPEKTETELAIFDFDGVGETAKTRFSGEIGRIPTWGPGKTILLWVMENGMRKLHAIEPATDEVPTLVRQSDAVETNIEADWSPDGKQIVFSYNPTN